MTSYLHLRLLRDRRSLEEEVCRLRLGRLLALGMADCSLTIGHAGANSAQLRASRLIVCALRRVGRVRLDRLLAIGPSGCLLQSAVPLPNSAQLQPNRPIFVLKSCLRLGWPTRLPIPRQHHIAVKRILRNLAHTPSLGLWYPKGTEFDLIGYSDSDWDGDSVDRKFTS